MSDTQQVVLTDAAKEVLKQRLAADLRGLRERIQFLEGSLDSLFQRDITQRVSSALTGGTRSMGLYIGNLERAFDQALGIAPPPAPAPQQPPGATSGGQNLEGFLRKAWPTASNGQ